MNKMMMVILDDDAMNSETCTAERYSIGKQCTG
jgi:hypothetical protein